MYNSFIGSTKRRYSSLGGFFSEKKFNDKVPHVENDVYDYLKERHYPGNIRELKNLVDNIVIRYSGAGPITLGDIPFQERSYTTKIPEKWYEKNGFVDAINTAILDGHDLKQIEETVKSITTKIALGFSTKNKEASRLLGKSERWIQLQLARK